MTASYACCFCSEAIERTDNDALHLIAQNLWKRDPERDAAQAVYAHSRCAVEHMAAGQLTPSALQDEANYSLQEIAWGENEGERVRLPLWAIVAVLLALAVGGILLFR